MKKLGIFLSMFPEAHETFILRELSGLDRKGVDFEVFSLQHPRHPIMHPDAERLAQKTHYSKLLTTQTLLALASSFARHPLRMIKAILTITCATITRPRDLLHSLGIFPISLYFAKLMRQRGITHAHGHWRNVPTTACWIINIVEGIPWSAAIHGEDIFTPNHFLRQKLCDAKFIAVCTAYSWRHLREKMGLPRPSDIHLNYHGLDNLVWEEAKKRCSHIPKDTTEKIILSVGRLFEFKGYDFTLEAVAKLVRDGYNLQFNIIGEGPREKLLREKCSKLGIEKQVDFLGLLPFPEVIRRMQQADVLIQASIYMDDDHFDGIPNVIAEAMAQGTPVIATRVSGIPELVKDKVSGLLVDEKDTVQLAEAIKTIVDGRINIDDLVCAAENKVKCMFDQDKNINELIELFERYAG